MNILRAGMALVWSATVCVGLGPLVVGCSEKICEPGKSESCACTDGGDGAQVCLDDGSGWGTCECGASDDDDDSGSAGDDDDSVADDDDDSGTTDDDDSVTDDDDVSDDDDDTTAPPLEVHFGTWQYQQTHVSADGCGLFVEYGPLQDDGPMDVTDDGGGQFTLTPLRGDAATCTLSDHNFICGARLTYQENLMDMGLDAVLQIHATTTGVFSANDAMNGNHNGTASCAGPQCSEFEATLAGTFPCNVAVSFSATFP